MELVFNLNCVAKYKSGVKVIEDQFSNLYSVQHFSEISILLYLEMLSFQHHYLCMISTMSEGSQSLITVFPKDSHNKLDKFETVAGGLDVVDHHPDVHLLFQVLLVHSLLQYSGFVVPN